MFEIVLTTEQYDEVRRLVDRELRSLEGKPKSERQHLLQDILFELLSAPEAEEDEESDA